MLPVVRLEMTDDAGWVALARAMKAVAWSVGAVGARVADRQAKAAGVGLLDRGDVRLVDVGAPDGARGLVSVSLSLEHVPGPGDVRAWHLSATGMPKGPTESPVRVADGLVLKLVAAFGPGLVEGGGGGATRHFYGVAD